MHTHKTAVSWDKHLLYALGNVKKKISRKILIIELRALWWHLRCCGGLALNLPALGPGGSTCPSSLRAGPRVRTAPPVVSIWECPSAFCFHSSAEPSICLIRGAVLLLCIHELRLSCISYKLCEHHFFLSLFKIVLKIGSFLYCSITPLPPNWLKVPCKPPGGGLFACITEKLLFSLHKIEKCLNI